MRGEALKVCVYGDDLARARRCVTVRRRIGVAGCIVSIDADPGCVARVRWIPYRPQLSPMNVALVARHVSEAEAATDGVSAKLPRQPALFEWLRAVVRQSSTEVAAEPLQPAQHDDTSEPLGEPACGAPGPFWRLW